MRKRTVKNVANTIFWYIIYALPIIVFIACLFAGSYNVFGVNRADPGYGIIFLVRDFNVDFFYSQAGIDPMTEVIGNVIYLIMGDGMTDVATFVAYCLGWFVTAHIAHIMVDAILFIPRLAHKWMEKFTVEE